jgi:hypothetical protein
VSSSWSETSGSTSTSTPIGAIAILQPAGYRAFERGDLQKRVSVNRTSVHRTGIAAPRAGTNIPEEYGVALPSARRIR